MKRLLTILALSISMISTVFAVGVSDIPAIVSGAGNLLEDARNLVVFAQKLQTLSDENFTISVIESTQTVALNNLQKSGLIAQYSNLKKKMQDDFQALP